MCLILPPPSDLGLLLGGQALLLAVRWGQLRRAPRGSWKLRRPEDHQFKGLDSQRENISTQKHRKSLQLNFKLYNQALWAPHANTSGQEKDPGGAN